MSICNLLLFDVLHSHTRMHIHTHTRTHTHAHTHTLTLTHTRTHTHTHLYTGEDDITDITKELSGFEVHYYNFGLSLHLSPGKVTVIQVNNPHDCETAFGQVIVQWLLMNYNLAIFGPPSWQMLVNAVDTIDHQLAKQIASNHQR